MVRIISLVGLMCFAVAATATNPPPSPPQDTMNWKALSREAPSDGFLLGSMLVGFEKTTLGEIIAATGKGAIDHRGDAGDSEYWLCYSLPNQAQRIWVVSSGEMGGKDHLVTGLVAEQLRAAGGTEDCPALPAKTTVALAGHKGWLGMTAKDVARRFGTPSHEMGAWQVFYFREKLRGVCGGEGERVNWLWIRQANGHVQTIIAGQVTSC